MFSLNSRKLTGLTICIGALFLLVFVYVIANALWGVSDRLFEAVGGFITMLGGSHQGAQMMADRSPNYPNQPPPPPP